MTKSANFQLLWNRLVFIKNNNHSRVVSSVFLYGRANKGGGVQDNFSTSSLLKKYFDIDVWQFFVLSCF